MTENFTIIKGSFGYALNFTLKDSEGAARNLTNYSVKLQVWSPLVPGTLLLDAACTWTDASLGTCYYTIPAVTTFATVGVFQYAIVPYVGTTILDPALSGFITVTQYGGNYCTLEEVKRELEITGAEKDASLESMIESVKGLIDSYCGRSFSTVAETRYFDGAGDVLFIDDLVLISGVGDGIWQDDGTRAYASAMAATDYDLYPLNKTPKTRVELTPLSDYGAFAEGIRKGIKIVATWGYQATVPPDVRRAAIMWVTILETGRKAGYSNVVGNSETGQITIDRDPPAQVKKILDRGFKKTRYF